MRVILSWVSRTYAKATSSIVFALRQVVSKFSLYHAKVSTMLRFPNHQPPSIHWSFLHYPLIPLSTKKSTKNLTANNYFHSHRTWLLLLLFFIFFVNHHPHQNQKKLSIRPLTHLTIELSPKHHQNNRNYYTNYQLFGCKPHWFIHHAITKLFFIIHSILLDYCLNPLFHCWL